MKLWSYLFGEDLFISYSRADATAYAAALANELAAKGFSCFVDQWETQPGQVVPPKVLKVLSRSTMLVVVGSRAGAASPAVEHEVQTFLQTGRSIVPISVDKALESAPWFNRIVGAAISAEDVQSLADGVPSKSVLTRIESSFRFTKRNQRVQIGFAVASLGLLALIGVSSWSTWQARSSQQAAVRSAAQAKVAQQTAQTEAERAQAQEAIARVSLQQKQEQQAIAESKAREADQQAAAARRGAEMAERQRLVAEERQKVGRARLLMYESRIRSQDDPALALLLAAQAERESPSLETTDHLSDALNAMPALAQVLHGHSSPVIGIGVLGSSSQLVSVDDSGMVLVRDPSRSSALKSYELGVKRVDRVALNPAGTLLAFASDRQLRVFDLVAGSLLPDGVARNTGSIASICFSSDGRTLVSGTWDNEVAIWRVGDTLERIGGFRGHRDRPSGLSMAMGVHGCALTADGRLLATVGGDGQALLWQMPAGTPAAVTPTEAPAGPQSLSPGLSSAAFGAKDEWLAAGSGNGDIHVWGLQTGRPVGPSLRGHRGKVTALSFAGAGQVLFSGAEDGEVRAWGPADGQVLTELRGHRWGGVRSLHFDTLSDRLYSGGSDGRLLVWRPFDRQDRLARAFIHPAPDSKPFGNARTGRRHFPDVLRAVCLSRSTRLIASAADDGSVVVWDLASGKELDRFQAFRDTAFALAISPDDATVAVAGANGGVVLRRIGGASTRVLAGHGLAAGTLDFSSDGRQLAVGARNGTVAVWDVATASREVELRSAHASGVSLVRFGRQPGTLISAGFDGRVVKWNHRSGALLRETKFDTRGSDEQLGFALGTGTVIARTETGLSFWNTEYWRPARPPIEIKEVERVAISPDGALFATEHQARLTLWSTATGERMSGGAKLRGSISTRGSASQIAFSADSKGVATVGAGALVLFHDIRPDARLRTACAIANRTFSAAERREFGLNAATDPCAPPGDHAYKTTSRVAGR